MAKVLAKGLSVNFQVDSFTGDNTSTALTLTQTPYALSATLVFVDGLYTTGSTLSGSTLTLPSAPAVGSDIVVWYLRST